jgi:hypothetical protein
LSAQPEEVAADPFDRVYGEWAEHALAKRLDPPSREVWDSIVLRLILSEDPDRVRRYRRLDAPGDWGLGADAFELWRKMPEYTPNLTIKARTVRQVREYEESTRGSMRRLMESQGLGERYRTLMEAQPSRSEVDATRARQAQARILTMGCIGIFAIIFMVLTVLLIIALSGRG